MNSSVRLPLVLLAAAEVVVVILAVMGIEALNSQDAGIEIFPVIARSVVVAAALFACMVSMGLYHFHQRLYFREILARVAVSVAMATTILAAAYFVIPYLALSRPVAIEAAIVSFSLIIAIRLYFFRHVDTNVFRRRTLVYGQGNGEKAIGKLRRRADRRGFVVVATIDEKDKNGTLRDLAEEHRADEIVIAVHDRRGKLPAGELLECIFHGVSVIELHEFLERESGKVPTDLINPSSLIYSPGFRSSKFRRLLNRSFDLAIGSAVMLVAWPVMLLVCLAILAEDGFKADVFYRQKRVGYKGAVFSILKFRSMIEDAESKTGAVWASEDDDRITRVGSVIRKLRLDELPQLFNVLRGDMSIVGPRPERPEFVEELSAVIPFYAERHMVKPGITGWAQLRYPYGSSDKDALHKLQYDLYYIKNRSITLDIMLILQTLEVVLFRKGAR